MNYISISLKNSVLNFHIYIRRSNYTNAIISHSGINDFYSINSVLRSQKSGF